MNRCTPRFLAVILPLLLSPATGIAQDALSDLNAKASDRPSLASQDQADWLTGTYTASPGRYGPRG